MVTSAARPVGCVGCGGARRRRRRDYVEIDMRTSSGTVLSVVGRVRRIGGPRRNWRPVGPGGPRAPVEVLVGPCNRILAVLVVPMAGARPAAFAMAGTCTHRGVESPGSPWPEMPEHFEGYHKVKTESNREGCQEEQGRVPRGAGTGGAVGRERGQATEVLLGQDGLKRLEKRMRYESG